MLSLILAFENLLGALWLILGVSREGLGCKVFKKKKKNPPLVKFTLEKSEITISSIFLVEKKTLIGCVWFWHVRNLLGAFWVNHLGVSREGLSDPMR
jgi:hypothetical protein